MAFPPNAFTAHDGRVYSEWEIHKLAAAGLRTLALAGVLGSLAMMVLDGVLFRDGRDPSLMPVVVSRLAMGLSTGVSAAFFGLATARKVEVQRPMALATMLALVLALCGGIASAAAGGFNGPLAFGLLPVLYVWPLVMPGGAKKAALPILGALAIHGALALLIGGKTLSLQAWGAAVTLKLSLIAALFTARTVEHWRSRAAELSQTDWLSGALSRPFLEERLNALCQQRQRSLAPVSLVMFDIDRFKGINDTYGRSAGDEVLEMMVSGIKSEIRASDFIGRFGGDEFLLVLDECEGNAAMSLLERLRHRFANKPMAVGDHSVKVSFAAGIVSVGPGDPLVMKELLRNAERALENSKEAGRNRTAMAPPPPPSDVSLDPTADAQQTHVGS